MLLQLGMKIPSCKPVRSSCGTAVLLSYAREPGPITGRLLEEKRGPLPCLTGQVFILYKMNHYSLLKFYSTHGYGRLPESLSTAQRKDPPGTLGRGEDHVGKEGLSQRQNRRHRGRCRHRRGDILPLLPDQGRAVSGTGRGNRSVSQGRDRSGQSPS